MIDPETGEIREPEDPEIDPEKFEQYRDQIEERDVTPGDFGRIAAQTAKQVILQRIREAERDMMFEEYRDRVGELITGIVQQSDSRYTLVQLRERVEALLPKSEQIDAERYEHSGRIKAVIKEVSRLDQGPVASSSPAATPSSSRSCSSWRCPRSPTASWRSPTSRASPATARRSRSSPTPTAWTPSGRASARAAPASGWSSPSCAARRSTSSPSTTSRPGSSPRRCRPPACARCWSTTRAKQATVIVPDDQLSLAIGREGQNARLAARLTGWRVDIRSETEFSAEEAEHGYDEEEVSGRCAAIMSNGRRCPNASLPGSRYCGLDSHQALRRFDTDKVAVLSGLDVTEIAALADPSAPTKTWPRSSIARPPLRPTPPAEPAADEPPPSDEPAAAETAAEAAPLPDAAPEPVAAEEPGVAADDPSRPRICRPKRPWRRTPLRARRAAGRGRARGGPGRRGRGMAREPLRRCVGCGRSAPKRELARLVARDGVVVPRSRRPTLPVAAPTCMPTPDCAARGLRPRPLARALRTTRDRPRSSS